MRVAIFSSTIDVTNGYGNITYEYCRALQAKGIEFTLFLPKGERAAGDQLGLKFTIAYILPSYIFRVKLWNVWGYLFPPSVNDFDLVHSLFDFPYCVSAAWAACRDRKPFIMGVQGTYGVLPLTYPRERRFLKWAYGQSKMIIVPSQFTKDKITSYAKRSYPITVIHNGVNMARFMQPVDPRGLAERYAGKIIIMTVGGLKARKGQDLVIRALAQLKGRWPNLRYVVVGKGELKDSYVALAQELGVEEMMDFPGNKIGPELVAWFDLADIFILTPKVVNDTVFEGFGIVYLEASARRKPIVATDAGGVRDAVVDGRTGLIVPDGDVEAIAAAIDKLLNDNELSRRIGEAGYEYAREHDWGMITDQFVKVYHEVIK